MQNKRLYKLPYLINVGLLGFRRFGRFERFWLFWKKIGHFWWWKWKMLLNQMILKMPAFSCFKIALCTAILLEIFNGSHIPNISLVNGV
jgi:hypothetical protein